MQANKFPALRGWVWLQAGFGLWRQAPLPLTAAAMTMVMCLLVSATIPFLGELAFHVLLPVLGVGLFCCCHAIANDRPAPPSMLFAGFRVRLPKLLGLAALRLLGDVLCVSLAVGITGLELSQLSEISGSDPKAAASVLQQVLPTAIWTLVLRIPFEMAAWFAAVLIALRGVPLGKALFFSFVACWRNLGALLVFIFLFSFLSGFLPALLLGLASAIAPGLASFLMAPVIMLLVPVFHASFYVCARDVFGEWPTP